MKVRYSQAEKRLLSFLLPLYILRFVFHIRVFYKYVQILPFVEDLNIEAKEYGIQLFDPKANIWSQMYTLCWAFAYDPYFLTLFYNRLNDDHKVIKILKRDNSSLHLYCSNIGKKFIMHHPFSTIVNARKVGDNCIIKNNVTIGNKYDNHSLTPIIGNNVTFGANCVVFGSIAIGNNVIIGAGAVVNRDVPDNSIVVGNPMRILPKK